MNRRDLLRGAIAGLLGSAVAVPLLEGPALSAEPTPAERDGYVRVERRGKFIGWAREETPNHEPVNIHRDENILNRRAVEAMGAQRPWTEAAKAMQDKIRRGGVKPDGFIHARELGGGVVSIEIRDDINTFRQQMNAIGPEAVAAADELSREVTRQLRRAIRKAASAHWSRL